MPIGVQDYNLLMDKHTRKSYNDIIKLDINVLSDMNINIMSFKLRNSQIEH